MDSCRVAIALAMQSSRCDSGSDPGLQLNRVGFIDLMRVLENSNRSNHLFSSWQSVREGEGERDEGDCGRLARRGRRREFSWEGEMGAGRFRLGLERNIYKEKRA